MTYEAKVSDDWMVDGVAIYVSVKMDSGNRRLLHVQPDGHGTWQTIEPLEPVSAPTLRLNGEAARALLDALLRYYQGSADTQTIRADLVHERGRVDRLTDAVIAIAQKGTSS